MLLGLSCLRFGRLFGYVECWFVCGCGCSARMGNLVFTLVYLLGVFLLVVGWWFVVALMGLGRMVRLWYLVLVVWFGCACWVWCFGWIGFGFWWLFLFGCTVFRVMLGL